MPELALALNLAAVVNGAILAAMLVFGRRAGDNPIGLSLAGFLALTSSSLAAFLLMDAGRLAWSPTIGLGLDLAALAASGLFVTYVLARLGQPVTIWPFAPALLFAVACVINQGRFGQPADIGHIVAVQVVLTTVATAFWMRTGLRRPAGDEKFEWRRLGVILGGIGLFHLSQGLRLLAPDNALLFEVVPILGALGLLSFSVYALSGSRALGSLIRRQRVTGAEPDAGEILAALERTGLYLDPDASLAKAAELLAVKPHVVSRALNAAGGISFPQAINGIRIEKAKRMLRAPEEARTSIDAVAGLCGFRSRSRFYVAFQEVVGMSPATWRKG